MSFFNNCKSDKIPGVIRGANGLNGICEKACIQVDKVLDMCMRQETLTDVTLTLDGGAVAGARFLSARTVTADATISDLEVTPMGDNSCMARVTGTVNIPLQVILLDDAGNRVVTTATLSVPKDVVLNVSAPSVIPYTIAASAGVVCPRGTVNGDTVTVTACMTVILKVLVPVQLLVPSYGYCYVPPCKDYNVQTCDGVFELPLYPQECGDDLRCQTTLRPNCSC